MQLEEEGTQVQALDTKPRIDGVEWLWEAWVTLGTCRSIGMEPGPIPWTAINDYAQRYGLCDDEFEELCYCVQHLEREYREHVAQTRKRQQRQQKVKPIGHSKR